jgi:hypothetical protein
MARTGFAVLLFAVLLLALTPTAPLLAWPVPEGIPLCSAPGAQHDPIVSCAQGCCLIWTDERHGHSQLYLRGFPGPGSGVSTDGTRIAPSEYDQVAPAVVSSSYDGATLVVWSEDRGTGTGPDLYAQRWTGSGRAAGWPEGGLLVCAAAGIQTSPQLAKDASGGAVVIWQDHRNGNADLYAQRLLPGGVAAGWPAAGLAVSTDARDDVAPRIVWPSSGGLLSETGPITAWTRGGAIVAQCVSPSGVVGGYDWPAAGLVLSDTDFVAAHPAIISQDLEGEVGATVVWEESHGSQLDIYGNWMTGTGSAMYSTGFAIANGATWDEHGPVALADGPYLSVVLEDDRSDAGDIYLQAGYLGTYWAEFFPESSEGLCIAPGRQGPLASSALDVFYHLTSFWEDRRAGDQLPRIFTNYPVGETVPPGGYPVAWAPAAQSAPSADCDDEGYHLPEFPYGYAHVAWTDSRNPSTAPDIYGTVVPREPASVEARVPSRVFLSPPRPMPARSVVGLSLDLPGDSEVALDVVDLAGRLVCPLAHGRLPAGTHDLRWSGSDAWGASAAAGVYWVRGTAGGVSLTRKLVWLR